MSKPIRELLDADAEWDVLLDTFYGLTDLDHDCFIELTESDDRLTVDELADQVGCNRTTAYRSVQRLLEADLVEQTKVSGEGSTYRHLYGVREADAIADQLLRELNAYYAEVGQHVRDLRIALGGTIPES